MENFNKLLSRSRSVCPHETAHRGSNECITGIMYAQTHIHVPRNKLIVAQSCILMNLIFAGSGTANSISRRQRDGVMVHGHVFEIKKKKPTIRPCAVVVLRLG